MRIVKLKTTSLWVAIVAICGIGDGVWAQSSSIHIIAVDRVFSARPRSIGYRYQVQISCRPEGENIVTIPVKRATFKWQTGRLLGESETDNNGRVEFTQTDFDGKLDDTLKINYYQRLLLFSAPKGVVELTLPVPCK